MANPPPNKRLDASVPDVLYIYTVMEIIVCPPTNTRPL